MYHFFTDASLIKGKDIYIEGKDHNHIKNVLRLSPGEVVSVSDRSGGSEYRCHIEAYEEGRVHLRLDFIKEADVELPVRVILLQGIPKSDKMDMIVQKAVELGVAEIVPVELKRCVTKLDEKKKKSRTERWRAIAEAAAKQSKRAYIPEISPVMSFEEALEHVRNCENKLIPYELSENISSTASVIKAVRPGTVVAVFIGPEGGFEEEEVKTALKEGFTDISLGRRILRTETAALVVLSWLILTLEMGE